MLFLKPRILDFAITNYCNLSCPFCSQSTPIDKSRSFVALSELAHYAAVFRRSHAGKTVSISGGEPTLHPNFAELCLHLPIWFPRAARFDMVSNGSRLVAHRQLVIDIFDYVEVAHYVGRNDADVAAVEAARMPNVEVRRKYEFKNLQDTRIYPNREKRFLHHRCLLTRSQKVVGDRIYPCCAAYGVCLRRGIPVEHFSTVVSDGWEQRLDLIPLDDLCRRCHVDVSAQMGLMAIRVKLNELRSRRKHKAS